ncbi:hypothetical protein Cs7R123_64930 [Catellatospora sp. TT07R-123]|uniref:hypothetical protein n=1 Tax=Catellatospora sp. TT07R-123 TaxID=2733863 RepID=UPI001B269FFA|nr:hypothetical protein [Catellatospora sp. TT07R-123]GHJ49151.1 hypothetical protein Cs7R123_64930 [Catellatospora sp. TT07R-123]
MTRPWLRLTALVLTAALTGCSVNGPADRDADPPAACATPDAVTVQTDSAVWQQALSGVGTPVEAHWLARPAANACSRAPGLSDWYHEVVLRLQPDVARALASAYQWAPVTEAPKIHAKLAPFVPAGTTWSRSDGYEQAHLMGPWFGALYLDAAHGLAYFDLNQS